MSASRGALADLLTEENPSEESVVEENPVTEENAHRPLPRIYPRPSRKEIFPMIQALIREGEDALLQEPHNLAKAREAYLQADVLHAHALTADERKSRPDILDRFFYLANDIRAVGFGGRPTGRNPPASDSTEDNPTEAAVTEENRRRNSSGHTPGPWEAVEDASGWWDVEDTKSEDALVERLTKADAHLIAAAPDLLSVVERAVDHKMLGTGTIASDALTALKKAGVPPRPNPPEEEVTEENHSPSVETEDNPRGVKYTPADFTIVRGRETGDERIAYTFRSADGKIDANVFWEKEGVKMRSLVGDAGTLEVEYPGMALPPPARFLTDLISKLKRGAFEGSFRSARSKSNPSSDSTEEPDMKTNANAPAKKTETSQATAPAVATAPAAPSPAATPSAAPPVAPGGSATSANPSAPATPPPKSEELASVGGAALPETGAAPNPAPATDATPAPAEAPKTDGASPNPPAEAPAASAQSPSVEAAAANPATETVPPYAQALTTEMNPPRWSLGKEPVFKTKSAARKYVEPLTGKWVAVRRPGGYGVNRLYTTKKAAAASAKFWHEKTGVSFYVTKGSGGYFVTVHKPGLKTNPISAVTVVNDPTCPKDNTKLQRTQVIITNPPEASGRHVLRCGKCGSQYRLK